MVRGSLIGIVEREASFPKGRGREREETGGEESGEGWTERMGDLERERRDRLMERGRYNVGNSQMGKGCITYGASKKRSLPRGI